MGRKNEILRSPTERNHRKPQNSQQEFLKKVVQREQRHQLLRHKGQTKRTEARSSEALGQSRHHRRSPLLQLEKAGREDEEYQRSDCHDQGQQRLPPLGKSKEHAD